MPSTMRSPILGEPPPLSWADAFNSSPLWGRFFGRRAQLSSYGRHRRPDEPSFPKGELKAQSISYFLNAPLKTDRIAGTRNYCRRRDNVAASKQRGIRRSASFRRHDAASSQAFQLVRSRDPTRSHRQDNKHFVVLGLHQASSVAAELRCSELRGYCDRQLHCTCLHYAHESTRSTRRSFCRARSHPSHTEPDHRMRSCYRATSRA